ncbi:MAG: PPC domain-containing protein [Planctomycetes bacterium]|nr:PPC domain-containing protein [Planctomycetota bacterium]
MRPSMMAAVLMLASIALGAEAEAPAPAKKPAPARKSAAAKKTAPAKKGGAAKKDVRPPVLQVAPPFISSIFPAGGQRGRTVEVAVEGTNLTGIEAVRIAGGGVTGRVVETKDAKALRIAVAIASDAQAGERDLRLVSAGGASNRFRFAVGDLPEIVEMEPGSEGDPVQALPSLPVVINGQLFQADRDTYRFRAKAGEVIVLEARARALLPYIADAVPGWCDPCLTLRDAGGKEIDSVDDFRFHPDPLIVFPVPSDGDYSIEIRDSLYRGRADFIYRLTAGALPYITDIFPLGARRGFSATVILRGANLPSDRLDLAVPEDAPRVLRVGLERGGLAQNRLPFAVGDGPEVLETEPNDAPPANRVDVPVTINGRIDRPGDKDLFAFRARAKERLVIEVFARRLESPLDAIITIIDARGRELAENDDTVDPSESLVTHHADARLVYTFPAAGEYVARIRDAQGKGGEAYAYRLSIGPERPDFALRVTPDTIRLGRGETGMLTVDAIRKDGFDGEIRIAVENLPAGFAASDAAIPAGQTQVQMTITAPAGARPGLVAPRVLGTSTIGGRTIARGADPAETVMQAFSFTYNVPTEELLLAVASQTAFTLTAQVPAGEVLEIPREGEAQVLVKVFRPQGVRGTITLSSTTVRGRPTSGILIKAVPVPADKDEAPVVISATRQAPVGFRQNLIIYGTLRLGKETVVRVAPAIPIRVVAPKG